MLHEKVRAGEIISSDLMNFIINKLEELEANVNNLGQLNQVRIREITPSAGGFVNGFIRINGTNFLNPPGDNVIRIDGQLVTEFAPPSTSEILNCRVPSSINIINPLGEVVIVHVENSEFGSNEASYLLFPESTQADLDIISVLRENGSDLLQTGNLAIITGEGFSTNASANSITLTAIIGGREIEIEVTDKPINSNTEIRFIVPDIEAVEIGDSQRMVLVLTVGDRTVSINTDILRFVD